MILTDEETWPDGTVSRAWFDETRRYRYMLERDFRRNLFDELVPVSRTATFILLNPSTATAMRDDPTVARCSAFVKRWGYQRLLVVNIFAIRGTDPAILKTEPKPIGEDNDSFILSANAESLLTIAGWGVHGAERGRGAEVARMLKDAGRFLHCLGTTKDGSPRHPLYLRGDAMPERYDA